MRVYAMHRWKDLPPVNVDVFVFIFHLVHLICMKYIEEFSICHVVNDFVRIVMTFVLYLDFRSVCADAGVLVEINLISLQMLLYTQRKKEEPFQYNKIYVVSFCHISHAPETETEVSRIPQFDQKFQTKNEIARLFNMCLLRDYRILFAHQFWNAMSLHIDIMFSQNRLNRRLKMEGKMGHGKSQQCGFFMGNQWRLFPSSCCVKFYRGFITLVNFTNSTEEKKGRQKLGKKWSVFLKRFSMDCFSGNKHRFTLYCVCVSAKRDIKG